MIFHRVASPIIATFPLRLAVQRLATTVLCVLVAFAESSKKLAELWETVSAANKEVRACSRVLSVANVVYPGVHVDVVDFTS